MKKDPKEHVEQPVVHPVPQPIVQPMIDELTGKREKPEVGRTENASKPQSPPQPAEQDQDTGGGYNRDHTEPQT